MSAVERLLRDYRPAVPYAAVRRPLAWITIEDALLRMRVSELFARAGYAFVELTDPARLIATLAEAMAPDHKINRPTIAVVDLDPIDTDPIELLETLRVAAPGLPLIALIESTDLAVFERASRLDINVLFVKPFDLELLRTAAVTFASFP